MKLVKFVKIGAPAVTVALIAACGTSKAPAPAPSVQTQSNLGFVINTPTADFTGNSVQICGARTPPADAKYA